MFGEELKRLIDLILLHTVGRTIPSNLEAGLFGF